MAYFNDAHALTAAEEGGYAKIEGDNGGETMWGIARNFWGEDKRLREFWRELDFYKNGLKDLRHAASKSAYYAELNALCNGNTIMQAAAKAFYRAEFWDKIKGDDIVSQKVANQFFDWYVNAGKNAIKRVQRVLGVADDGIFGAKSLAALNARIMASGGETELNTAIYMARRAYYEGLNKPKFLKGWLARASRFA